MRGALAGHRGDPYSQYVIALLHFNGANGSTTIIDQTGRAWLDIGTTGIISTAQSAFGGASFTPGATLGYAKTLSIPDFGSADFTFEFWVYPTAVTVPPNVSATVYSKSDQTSSKAVEIFTSPTTGKMNFRVYVGTTLIVATDSTAPTLNSWTYFACVRDGGTLRMYRGIAGGNATQVASASITGSINANSLPGLIAIGQFGGSPAGNSKWIGYIDEVRITGTICRYPNGTSFPVQPLQWTYP